MQRFWVRLYSIIWLTVAPCDLEKQTQGCPIFTRVFIVLHSESCSVLMLNSMLCAGPTALVPGKGSLTISLKLHTCICRLKTWMDDLISRSMQIIAFRPNPHWARECKFAGTSSHVACIQCGHSHSQQQVPFACAFPLRPVWFGPYSWGCVFLWTDSGNHHQIYRHLCGGTHGFDATTNTMCWIAMAE